MTMIILGTIIGIVYLVLTINGLKKHIKQLENIDLSKYTKVEASKISTYLIIGILLLSVLLLITGFNYKNTDNISLGIMLFFLGVSELINNISLNTYYYNKTHLILQAKLIRIKSIKSLEKTSAFLVKRYKLTTLNGDETILTLKQGQHIEELIKK